MCICTLLPLSFFHHAPYSFQHRIRLPLWSTPCNIPRYGEEQNWYDVDGWRVGADPRKKWRWTAGRKMEKHLHRCNICLSIWHRYHWISCMYPSQKHQHWRSLLFRKIGGKIASAKFHNTVPALLGMCVVSFLGSFDKCKLTHLKTFFSGVVYKLVCSIPARKILVMTMMILIFEE